jgi:outer membrane protein TolC
MMSWVHGVMLLVFLSACTMVGPDFVQPTADVSQEWIEAKNERVKTAPPDFKNWWKVFNDPALDQLIQTAYEQNLPLRIAGVRVFEARAQLGIVIGEFYPQVQEGFGLTLESVPAGSLISGESFGVPSSQLMPAF